MLMTMILAMITVGNIDVDGGDADGDDSGDDDCCRPDVTVLVDWA